MKANMMLNLESLPPTLSSLAFERLLTVHVIVPSVVQLSVSLSLPVNVALKIYRIGYDLELRNCCKCLFYLSHRHKVWKILIVQITSLGFRMNSRFSMLMPEIIEVFIDERTCYSWVVFVSIKLYLKDFQLTLTMCDQGTLLVKKNITFCFKIGLVFYLSFWKSHLEKLKFRNYDSRTSGDLRVLSPSSTFCQYFGLIEIRGRITELFINVFSNIFHISK